VHEDQDDSPIGRYLRQVKAKVDWQWEPPPGAKGGTRAAVRFVIASDGRLIGGPVLEISSGSRSFDESAVRAVNEAQPFAPLSAELGTRSLRVHFDFELP
jgi:TonB family protein